MGENERFINREERAEIEEAEAAAELNNVNPELVKRVFGAYTLDYYVPVDPMDDLQCESCQ